MPNTWDFSMEFVNVNWPFWLAIIQNKPYFLPTKSIEMVLLDSWRIRLMKKIFLSILSELISKEVSHCFTGVKKCIKMRVWKKGPSEKFVLWRKIFVGLSINKFHRKISCDRHFQLNCVQAHRRAFWKCLCSQHYYGVLGYESRLQINDKLLVLERGSKMNFNLIVALLVQTK